MSRTENIESASAVIRADRIYRRRVPPGVMARIFFLQTSRLLGGGNQNCRIEENIHWSYAFKTDAIRSSRTSSRMRSQFAPGSALP